MYPPPPDPIHLLAVGLRRPALWDLQIRSGLTIGVAGLALLLPCDAPAALWPEART